MELTPEVLDKLEERANTLLLHESRTMPYVDFAANVQPYLAALVQAARENQELRAQNDPQWDATDAAHPAWWRGCDHGVSEMCRVIREVLDKTDTGAGVMSEEPQQVREAVRALQVRLEKAEKVCDAAKNYLAQFDGKGSWRTASRFYHDMQDGLREWEANQ